jgi:uncharacterized protein with NRDE domain
MCTLVILRRPDHAWPIIIGANRDEMVDRPWLPPGRHWPDREDVVAGQDLEAGGTWLGLNDHGVIAGILNRPGSLGPAPDKRSRGELVLEALDHADASVAADALSHIDGRAYRPFNLVLADNRDAYWLRCDGDAVERFPVPPGLSIITSHDLNDPGTARINRFRPQFQAAPPPDPETGNWTAWQDLLANASPGPGGDAAAAMTIETSLGFETVSSSLIAVPAIERAETPPVWLFAAGRPDNNGYVKINI